MAIIAYTRVSRFDQTVEGQLLEIQNAGYTLDPELTFSDYGVSGKELARPKPCSNAWNAATRIMPIPSARSIF